MVGEIEGQKRGRPGEETREMGNEGVVHLQVKVRNKGVSLKTR